MSEAPRDEILNLWPTVVGEARLAGAEAPNRALAELAGTAGLAGNLFETAHEAAVWLRDRVAAAIAEWFEHAQVRPAPAWRLGGRLEALGFGQYRELGNDPGAYLAGLYFVNEPPAPELDHLRSDCLPSRVTLFDPRVGFNALALEGDPNFNETRTLVPEPGMLMLWPGYLRHFSRVHLSHRPWVRVALRVEVEPR